DTSKLTPLAKEAFASFPQIDGQRFAILQDATVGGDYARARQNPRFNSSPLMQFADTFSWTRNNHSFQGEFEATFSKCGQYHSLYIRASANLGIGSVGISGITTTNFGGLHTKDVAFAQTLLANLAGSIDSLSQDFFLLSPNDKAFKAFQNGGVIKTRN